MIVKPVSPLLKRFAALKRYSKEPYGIAFKKGESTVKLKENLDFIIEDLQRKNVIPRLRHKWGIR